MTVAAASVCPVRFHDLRHTFGTQHAAAAGAPLRTLQEWMGHRDYETTLIYADYAQRALLEAAFSAGARDVRHATTAPREAVEPPDLDPGENSAAGRQRLLEQLGNLQAGEAQATQRSDRLLTAAVGDQ